MGKERTTYQSLPGQSQTFYPFDNPPKYRIACPAAWVELLAKCYLERLSSRFLFVREVKSRGCDKIVLDSFHLRNVNTIAKVN